MRKFTYILAVGALVLMGTSCRQLKSRDQVNQGVQAFKSAQYPQAVEHFKQAVDLDPGFVAARVYLGTAYYQQYIPGAVSPENDQMAAAAYDQFQKVLEQDPKNIVAIASIANLYLNQKKWDEAQQWFEKELAVDPKNADAHYSLGFVAWSKWYPADGAARAESGMKLDDPGPIKDKKLREELRAKYGPVIENGLEHLNKCLEINPEYDDAMAYENLLIRERADLDDTKPAYEADIKTADGWMQKALDTKKLKEEKKSKQSGGGIVADPNAK